MEVSVCLFTQCVDDAHGELNTEEHEGPACSPEAPRLHAVVLVLFSKNLLQETNIRILNIRTHLCFLPKKNKQNKTHSIQDMK